MNPVRNLVFCVKIDISNGVKLFFWARFIVTIICLVFLFIPGYAAEGTLKGESFIGIIAGNRVNIRASDNITAEVLCQLNDGDEVKVVGENKMWYKVELPKKVLVYIHKSNVERKDATGVVSENKSNIRTAATQSSTIVGRLDKGENIKIIKEYLDWYEIEAPRNSFGWIHSDYLRKKGSNEPHKADLAKNKLAELDEAYRQELKKPLRQIDLEGILEEYQKFIVQFQGSTEAEEAAMRMAELKLKIAELEHLKAKEEYETKLKGIESPRPGEQPLATGIIEDVGIIYARRSQFKLVKDGKPIGYLTSKKVDLNKYVNLEVNVWGVKKEAKSSMPLIEVDAVQIIQ